MMTTSAPTAAPCWKPTMSGEPSGLRVSDWKIAPEMPSATPHQQRAQDARQAQLADDELRARGRRPEQRAITAPGGIGKSPVPTRRPQGEHGAAPGRPTTTGRGWTRSETVAGEPHDAPVEPATALTARRSASGARAR